MSLFYKKKRCLTLMSLFIGITGSLFFFPLKLDKNVLEGTYVETSTRIYTIADLSQMWVVLDAYESDLQWLKYGQEVEFTTETYPGVIFKGRIAFIDPLLNPKTRTV